jgi:hypothetical protein
LALLPKHYGCRRSRGSPFLVYCQIGPDHCAFLVRVPALWQYTARDKGTLRTLSWQTARTVMETWAPGRDVELAVALRGAVLYDSIQIGRSAGPPVLYENAMREIGRLYPFFASASVAWPTPTTADKDQTAGDPARLLPGRWASERGGAHTELIILESGDLRSVSTARGRPTWTLSGRWSVQGTRVLWQYTESSMPIPAAMREDTNEILRLTDRQLVVKEMDGSVTSFTRVDSPS